MGEGGEGKGGEGSGDSRLAILAALGANLGIAISKYVAWLFTGSSSMLAEGLHSTADTGNQILLLIGGKRAARPATRLHPFGYGPFRYFYAFLVAITIFLVGGLFAVYEGYHKLRHPEPIESPVWAFAVLGVAIVLESISLATAVRQSQRARGRQSWVEFIRRTRAPELAVVLLEDLGALLGLAFAMAGVTLTVLTEDSTWDGVATVAIGLLLITVAFVLGRETRSLLIGESATDEMLAAIEAALAAEPGVLRVKDLRTMHLSPDELLITATVGVDADARAAEVARTLRGARRHINDAVDLRCIIYLEPTV